MKASLFKTTLRGFSSQPKVIAVIGATRSDVERAVLHVRAGENGLPIWAYCANDLSDNPAPPGCDRYVAGSEALRFRRDLRGSWPALAVVAWTGERSPVALKLRPLAVPPFRVLVLNEAGDFFAATPAGIARHVTRRTRDASVSRARRTVDWSRSFGWRAGELVRDIVKLVWSFLWRAGEHIGDIFGLLWSLVWRGFNWMRGLTLASLAGAARWAFPERSPAALGARPLAVPRVAPPASPTFTVVWIPDRGWPRRAVLRAIAQSDAEFVVFRWRAEQAGAAEISAMIACARETGAFAVAKQTAHSAWRKRLVPKHPFRRLQPGEVSEVFAPFSSLLVVRRSLLESLGVPRALTFGAALLILFWKASAAGLRSVAFGHEGVVTDEPAMELEDTELALRLRLSRSLRALGPARPARFRGNVAWSPEHSRPLRGKPRVLVVSPYLPFPLSHGGAVRIYNLCRALQDRVDFVLACFRESNETVDYGRLHDVFREVHIVDQDEVTRDASVPRQIPEYRNAAMRDLIWSLCSERRVDVVQLEYTQLAEYRDSTGAVPVILVEHDITFTLYRQLAKADRNVETRREYERWLDFEREALQCSTRVWTMSLDDHAEAVSHGAVAGRTDVIPNGVDLERYQVAPEPVGPPAILFVGSFRHLPNLLAFKALRGEIMPAVWREFPEATLHVIAGPGKLEVSEDDPRVVIEGFVADVRPAYAAVHVVAVPLPVSAGTNIKVMEAMACGRAVVSTSAGCRGLDLRDGRDLIVAETDAFAQAIIRLLRDASLCSNIGREARRTAELRFGWDRIAEDALRSYATLLESPQHVERGLEFAAGVVVAESAGDFDTPAV